MRTNTDLTLYKKSVVAGAEVWTRSVIENVHWENCKAANVIKSGLLEADSVVVYIPDITVSIKPGDVITKGTVTKVISETYTMTNLKTDYPNTFTVKSVDVKDFGSVSMQHIQVGAG